MTRFVWLCALLSTANAVCVCEVTRADLLKLEDRVVQLEQRARNEDRKWDFDPGFLAFVPPPRQKYNYGMYLGGAVSLLPPQPIRIPGVHVRDPVPWPQAMYCHPASRDPESACTDAGMRVFLQPRAYEQMIEENMRVYREKLDRELARLQYLPSALLIITDAISRQ